MLRSLALVLPFLFATLVAVAADHAHAHGASASTEVGASACVDAAGVIWAVHKVSGHVAVSRSVDRGQSWSNPVLVTASPEATDPGGDARPKIAAGQDGEIYVTWTRPLAKPFTGAVRFSRSLDGGRTFSPSAVVHRDRQEITHRFDALSVTTEGRIVVAWIDKRDLAAAPTGSYRGAAVYFAVSEDRGATFRGDYKVADHACECCQIALAPRSDGTVVALWRHVFAPNVRDHAMAVLHADGRAGALRRVTFEDWRIDACPHHGPSLGIGHEGVAHALWFSAAPPARGVFYGQVGDDARAGPTRAVGRPNAGMAGMAVSGKRVAVAWKTFEEGRTILRGMWSEDAGQNWQEKVLGSVEGASDRPCVLMVDGEFFALWNSAAKPLAVFPFSSGNAESQH